MSTAITPMQAFTEKLQSKIRDDISGMLPDDVIIAMVEKATNSLFFEKRTVRRQNPRVQWTDMETVEVPNEFEVLVMEAVKPIIEKKVAEQVATLMPQIEASVAKALDDGLATLALKTVDVIFQSALMSKGFSIEESIRNQLRQRGVTI